MALATSLANAQRSRAADAVTARLNSGYLRIYSGTRPTDANTALSGNTLLAELRYNATAFGAASNGVATANAITSDSSADASGTATFCRSFESDGTTVVYDGDVGTATANLVLSTVTITAGNTVSVSSLTYTQPLAGS